MLFIFAITGHFLPFSNNLLSAKGPAQIDPLLSKTSQKEAKLKNDHVCIWKREALRNFASELYCARVRRPRKVKDILTF